MARTKDLNLELSHKNLLVLSTGKLTSWRFLGKRFWEGSNPLILKQCRRGWDLDSLHTLKPRNLLILHSDRMRENAKKAELRYTPGTRELCSIANCASRSGKYQEISGFSAKR
jgi:hypothetical protein